jgi:hypothetical protein
MKCQSCNKQKNDLIVKNSSLISGMSLYMCQTCIDSKFEPRWVIILASRQQDPSVVRNYIVKRRYVGRDISGSELIS